MKHIVTRFYRRAASGTLNHTEFKEESGSVCTAACRQDSRLENYHFEAQYRTQIFR